MNETDFIDGHVQAHGQAAMPSLRPIGPNETMHLPVHSAREIPPEFQCWGRAAGLVAYFTVLLAPFEEAEPLLQSSDTDRQAHMDARLYTPHMVIDGWRNKPAMLLGVRQNPRLGSLSVDSLYSYASTTRATAIGIGDFFSGGDEDHGITLRGANALDRPDTSSDYPTVPIISHGGDILVRIPTNKTELQKACRNILGWVTIDPEGDLIFSGPRVFLPPEITDPDAPESTILVKSSEPLYPLGDEFQEVSKVGREAIQAGLGIPVTRKEPDASTKEFINLEAALGTNRRRVTRRRRL